jgi:hypothetical protein
VEGKLVRELNRQAGTQVGAPLDTYAKLCSKWAGNVLDGQKARFDSYANRLRVRVQMAVADTALSEDELQRIRLDLDRIPLARSRAVIFQQSPPARNRESPKSEVEVIRYVHQEGARA